MLIVVEEISDGADMLARVEGRMKEESELILLISRITAFMSPYSRGATTRKGTCATKMTPG